MTNCSDSLVFRFLDFTVGNIFGKDITCHEPVYPCDAYQPGSIVDFGRTTVQLLRKFLIPGGLCGAVPIIKPAPPSPDKPVECSNNLNLIRPSELPIYINETSSPITTTSTTRSDDENVRSFLEQGFGRVRKDIGNVMEEYETITGGIGDKFSTGIAHSRVTLDYLREEDNSLPRIGAVAMGGLTGLIFSLRGGKFKKLIYTTAGALSVASVCYPNEAKESLTALKHYINIGYNFIYGVKPGDEKQLEIKWPELSKMTVPSSFSGFVDLVKTTGSNLTTTVTSLFGNEEKKSVDANEEKLKDQSKTKTN